MIKCYKFKNTSKPDQPSESESQGSAGEEGIQSHEISNNECVICFGLYQDDLLWKIID